MLEKVWRERNPPTMLVYTATVYMNVNWYSHCGKQYGGSLKN